MSEARCAHLRVEWRAEGLPGSLTIGWWECPECRTKFAPMAVAEAQMATLRGALEEIKMVYAGPWMQGAMGLAIAHGFSNFEGRTISGIADAALASAPATDPRDAEISALREALERISQIAEASYWGLRRWLDQQPDWVRGDDGPAYPFLAICRDIRVALSPVPSGYEACIRNNQRRRDIEIVRQVLAEYGRAYPVDVFPELPSPETESAEFRAHRTRAAAMAGRHFAKVVPEQIAAAILGAG